MQISVFIKLLLLNVYKEESLKDVSQFSFTTKVVAMDWVEVDRVFTAWPLVGMKLVGCSVSGCTTVEHCSSSLARYNFCSRAQADCKVVCSRAKAEGSEYDKFGDESQ